MEHLKAINKKIYNYLGNVIYFINHVDFKSMKQIKLCEGVSNIYAQGHSILAESACIY